MVTRTQIKIRPSDVKIGYNDPILSLGSCFSAHMADRLNALMYIVSSNPCGITFNPASLLTTVKRVCAPDSLHAEELIYQNGLYSHPDFHSSYNTLLSEDYLIYAKKGLIAASEVLKNAKFIILTIGTSFVFRSIANGKIVNNCHKLPAEAFSRELLAPVEIMETIEELRKIVLEQSDQNPHFILTVSPVRHTRNGLVEDRRSKAIASLAIHDIVDKYEDCHYFPSYEIMTDDLRDYRYYKADMIHPSSVAIDYIWDRFCECWLDPEDEDLRKKISGINKRRAHRPLFPDSEQHMQFQKQLNHDVDDLLSQNPFLQGRLS